MGSRIGWGLNLNNFDVFSDFVLQDRVELANIVWFLGELIVPALAVPGKPAFRVRVRPGVVFGWLHLVVRVRRWG